ncbi:SDR family oxidoreductase [Alteromonas sp. D210916BOD_24]|uniref:NAD-dependent epimerase/dehydratase family protein n=1 Tax=Alteromonas sp. D210916BOD_24 TaxID=3157618 RepID=UPI00399D2B0C
MKQQVVICGYGWLGGYLGTSLQRGNTIIGTVRNKEKATLLNKQGITAIQYTLGDDTGILCHYLKDATLVLNIPPGRKNNDLADFSSNMCSLINDAIAAGVAHILFISTTSVYGDSTENTVTEYSATHPESASAKAHVAIEHHLSSLADKVKVSIVRLAGLVGPDRHPAYSLSGRTVSAGNKRVNLVHINDVVDALRTIISSPSAQSLYVLCSTSHPKRGEYYTQAAQALHILPPEFSDTQLAPCGKVVDATQSWRALNLAPVYASPFDMY